MRCSVCYHGTPTGEDSLGRCAICVSRGALPPPETNPNVAENPKPPPKKKAKKKETEE